MKYRKSSFVCLGSDFMKNMFLWLLVQILIMWNPKDEFHCL